MEYVGLFEKEDRKSSMRRIKKQLMRETTINKLFLLGLS
jgi:hypothetical protein